MAALLSAHLWCALLTSPFMTGPWALGTHKIIETSAGTVRVTAVKLLQNGAQ